MDIVEFLEARFDEDDEVARILPRDTLSNPEVVAQWAGQPADYPLVRYYAHYHPSRGVVGTAAASLITVEHTPTGLFRDTCPVCARQCGMEQCGAAGEDHPCRTLRLLAMPYRDHPDYQQEWKP